MDRALRARTPECARLRDAALGPAGEWWLAYADGTHAADGLPPDLADAVFSRERAGHEITHMGFGAEGSWLLRCSERSQAVQGLLRRAD
mmetsp:Transcript_8691/g.22857  ORF Transcript_8691/g.22857 Transcript_8691/m.22857 type:complete len:89 (-) Transcript_8691:109-375(-)